MTSDCVPGHSSALILLVQLKHWVQQNLALAKKEMQWLKWHLVCRYWNYNWSKADLKKNTFVLWAPHSVSDPVLLLSQQRHLI